MRFHTLALAATLSACGGGETIAPPPPPPPAPVATTIQLAPPTLSLRIGESQTLTATVLDQQNRPMSGQSITWTSSDTTRLTVDGSGSARGVRPGTATLTASSGALSATAAGTVRTPTLQVENGGSVTTTIGEAGGVVSAQATNGTRYTLTVPPLALLNDVNITLTPVASFDNLPVGISVAAAVRLRPDGLEFLSPATLVMDLPAALSAPAIMGFRSDDDGSALTMVPIVANGAQLTMTLSHFTVYSGGYVDCENPPLATLAGTPRDVAVADLAAQEWKHYCMGGTWDAAAIVNILHKWFTTGVQPGLTAMATGGSSSAFGEWVEWKQKIADYTPIFVQNATLTADFGQAQTLAIAAIKAEIGRQNQTCTAQHDLQAANKVFQWQQQAQNAGIATSANGLDLTTIQNQLCVTIDLQQTSFPSSVQQGTPATLVVQAGLKFGTQAVSYTPSLRVDVTATGATPGTDSKTTDGSGQATFTFTPSGTSSTVTLQIRVRPNLTTLEAYGFYKDATINRQTSSVSISLTPTAALLDPGTQATFTAMVTGNGNTAVTWTTQGGTIAPPSGSNTVVYTAGSVPGQFNLTATSVADPSKSATAVIHVGLSSTPGVVQIQSGNVDRLVVINQPHPDPDCLHHDNREFQATPPPQVVFAEMTCTFNTKSPPDGNTGTASGKASTSYTLLNQSGQPITLTMTGNASTQYSGQGTGSANARGQANFTIQFKVVGAGVSYSLTGTLSGSGGPSTEPLSFAGAYVNFDLESGPSIDEYVGRIGSPCTSTPICLSSNPTSRTLNRTGFLGPGNYSFTVNADAQAREKNNAAGSFTGQSSFSITLTLTP